MAKEQQNPTFLQKLQLDPATLWKNHRAFLIGFGLLILIIKFREVIVDILVASSKTILEGAKKTDAQLKSEENQANSAANKLIDDAKKLDENKPKVDEDWYKK